jgi:hypothetical protein
LLQEIDPLTAMIAQRRHNRFIQGHMPRNQQRGTIAVGCDDFQSCAKSGGNPKEHLV